jgi:glycosyltransferase involved in cell wall biosynthesis
MGEPGISVVIPLFNKAHVIADVLLSVLNQSSPPDEVIVVDDGSRDGSFAIAQSLQHKCNQRFPMRVFRNPVNRGVSFTRNVGIAKASQEYIYFLDADDLMFKHTIANLRRAVSVAKPDIVFTKALFRNSGRTHPSRVIFRFAEKIDGELFQIVDPFGLLTVEFPFVGSNFAVRNLTNLRFHNDEFQFEDCLFVFKQLLHSKRIVYLDQFSILYHQDPFSSFSRKPLINPSRARLPRLYQIARYAGYPKISEHILQIWMAYLATRSSNRLLILNTLIQFRQPILRCFRINQMYLAPFLRILLPKTWFEYLRTHLRRG